MAAIDERVVRELAEFRATAGAVASCYLDVDGRRFVRPHDYELHLEDMLRRMSALMKGSKRVVIENAAHASNFDQPEAFNDAVTEFLRTRFGSK